MICTCLKRNEVKVNNTDTKYSMKSTVRTDGGFCGATAEHTGSPWCCWS